MLKLDQDLGTTSRMSELQAISLALLGHQPQTQ